MKKIDYKFTNIEVVELDSMVDDFEASGTLLKAYARIPVDGDGGGDGGGITGCDSAAMC